MQSAKKKRLEAAGWRVGTAAEFLGMTPEEEAFVEIRLRLADGLKKRRAQKNMTQIALAKAIQSSQSRIAKMEAGDPTVTVDLLIRALLALGVSSTELAQLIGLSSARKTSKSAQAAVVGR